jgi:predicted nucleic acid-binding protein
MSIVTSEFVLVELGNALSRGNDRGLFVDLDRALRGDPGIEIVPVSPDLYHDGVELFARRSDKMWSLVDCISFVIMNRRGVTEALKADQHFFSKPGSARCC